MKNKNTVQVKAILKRWVFRFGLKAPMAWEALRWSGREFHSLGAAELKARSPMVQSCSGGLKGVVLQIGGYDW